MFEGINLDLPGLNGKHVTSMSRFQLCNSCYESEKRFDSRFLCTHADCSSVQSAQVPSFASAGVLALLSLGSSVQVVNGVSDQEGRLKERLLWGRTAEANGKPEGLPHNMSLSQLRQEFVPPIPSTSDDGNPEMQSEIFDTRQVIASHPSALCDLMRCMRRRLSPVLKQRRLPETHIVMCAGILIVVSGEPLSV